MSKPVLSCRDLTFRYQKEDVFRQISFAIQPGEAVLLMGPSGCGKSSLAYCLAGLYPAYAGNLSGDILLEGKPLEDYPLAQRARGVSILFQNPDDQFCMDRVDHEILFALENINYPSDLRARTRELLALVGLEAVDHQLIHTLSGGMKLKLALATALATEAKLLILDEPFANLDPGSCADLSVKLAQLNRQGLALFIVDHRPDYWLPFLSRILLMDKTGNLLPESVLPEELQAHRELFRERGLFVDDSWLEGQSPAPLPQPEEPMIQAKDLRLLQGKTTVAEHLSFDIPQGGITALVGRNGSGKTTLLTCLAGAGRCKGSLKVNGTAGLVFQNPRFQFLSLTVEDEVLTTLRALEPKAEEQALRQKARALLEEFDLLAWHKHSPYELSQGQQRRLALLAMLAGNRPLLLLDEPTYAQDERATQFIMELLRRRIGQGLTAVIATHDLALARCFANRIYLLEDGRMQLLSPEQLDQYAKERSHAPCAL